ncbi:MAG: hypothetical protein ISS50_04940 [Anaerolineae bacterium]|nr:hypothetical protein [Anaerolineae bacterium]
MAWQWRGKTYETRAALDEAKRRYYKTISAQYRAQHLAKLRESEGARQEVALPQPAPEVAPPPPVVVVEPEKRRPEPCPEPRRRAVEGPDDLTRIRGVGAGIQYRLNRGGVCTFAQLASITPEEIHEFTGVSVEAVIRQRLIEQARELAAEVGSND